jgi:molybdopterin/thiamine biosynthesis adenylyltransferase
MTLSLITEPLPLQLNPDGVVRGGKTRVTLDTAVSAFNQGSTAEEIVFQLKQQESPTEFCNQNQWREEWWAMTN